MQNLINDHKIDRDLLQLLKTKFGGEVVGNRFVYDGKKASGFQQYVYVPHDIHIVISDYYTHEKMLVTKVATEEKIYTFRAGIIENSGFKITLAGESYVEDDSLSAHIGLFNSNNAVEFSFEPNTRVQGVTMNISLDLINHYFAGLNINVFLQELVEAGVNQMVVLDKIGRRTILEMINKSIYDENYNLFIRTRMLELIDYYFEQLLKIKKFVRLLNTKQWREQVENFKRLEMDILKDLSVKIPKIEQAAKRLYVSTTKFKMLFKDIYGDSYYEYYNTTRLKLAKLELIKGERSIKEISAMFGYNSTSQFSNAFKNYFNFSPSEVRTS